MNKESIAIKKVVEVNRGEIQIEISERLTFSVNDTGILGKKEIASVPNRSRTYDLPISTSDALPLSYRRLVVAGH